ncbi:MAG: DUF1992 domain-containing protein, partial [Nocardioidaceae bacterium]
MTERGSGHSEQRRLRRSAASAADRQPPAPPDTPEDPESEDDSAAGQRLEHQTLWVDLQVRQAMARGEFDNLPGTGKPIRGLGGTHDPDWWVKSLIEREKITGVLPPALGLRKEDAELDAVLDREATEEGVRGIVADFNERVVAARRQLLGGPPVITPTRDAEQEVAAWRERRDRRRAELRRRRDEAVAAEPAPARRKR